MIKIEDTKVNHRSSRATLIVIRFCVRWESRIISLLLETLSTAEPEQRNFSQYGNCYEEKEIALYKRHKKYFEEVQKLTSNIWCRTRQNNSLNFIRDMKLFMSRYSANNEFVSTCDGCAALLPWRKYRCLICFDSDLCESCYINGKQPNGHLSTHTMIELR